MKTGLDERAEGKEMLELSTNNQPGMLPAPEISPTSGKLWDSTADTAPHPGVVYLKQLPPYDELFCTIFMRNQLCIVGPDATSSWKSRNLWVSEDGTPDFEYISETFGQASGPVADCNAEEFCAHPKTTMTIESYVSYWRQYKSDGYPAHERCLYLKDWHFTKCFPTYSAYSTPEFLCSDWLNEFYDSVEDEQGGDDYRFVYMGPRGSWTPFHADVLRSYSWSANICGRKKWIFFPPGVEEMLQDPHGQLIFDLHSADLEDMTKFPCAALAMEQAIVVIQNPGEIIFVPSGWHHQVLNLEDTISINHNWINGCGIRYTWEYLKSRLAAVQKEIADCQGMDDWDKQCQLILKADAGIDYAGFYTFLVGIARDRLLTLRKFLIEREQVLKSSSSNQKKESKQNCSTEQGPKNLQTVLQSSSSPKDDRFEADLENCEAENSSFIELGKVKDEDLMRNQVDVIARASDQQGKPQRSQEDVGLETNKGKTKRNDLEKSSVVELLEGSKKCSHPKLPKKNTNEGWLSRKSAENLVGYMLQAKEILDTKILPNLLVPEEAAESVAGGVAGERFTYEEELEPEPVYEQEPEQGGAYEVEPDLSTEFIYEEEPETAPVYADEPSLGREDANEFSYVQKFVRSFIKGSLPSENASSQTDTDSPSVHPTGTGKPVSVTPSSAQERDSPGIASSSKKIISDDSVSPGATSSAKSSPLRMANSLSTPAFLGSPPSYHSDKPESLSANVLTTYWSTLATPPDSPLVISADNTPLSITKMLTPGENLSPGNLDCAGSDCTSSSLVNNLGDSLAPEQQKAGGAPHSPLKSDKNLLTMLLKSEHKKSSKKFPDRSLNVTRNNFDYGQILSADGAQEENESLMSESGNDSSAPENEARSELSQALTASGSAQSCPGNVLCASAKSVLPRKQKEGEFGAICCICHQAMGLKTGDSVRRNQTNVGGDKITGTVSHKSAVHTASAGKPRSVTVGDCIQTHDIFYQYNNKVICWHCFCQNFCHFETSSGTSGAMKKDASFVNYKAQENVTDEHPVFSSADHKMFVLCLYTQSLILLENGCSEARVTDKEKGRSLFLTCSPGLVALMNNTRETVKTAVETSNTVQSETHRKENNKFFTPNHQVSPRSTNTGHSSASPCNIKPVNVQTSKIPVRRKLSLTKDIKHTVPSAKPMSAAAHEETSSCVYAVQNSKASVNIHSSLAKDITHTVPSAKQRAPDAPEFTSSSASSGLAEPVTVVSDAQGSQYVPSPPTRTLLARGHSAISPAFSSKRSSPRTNSVAVKSGNTPITASSTAFTGEVLTVAPSCPDGQSDRLPSHSSQQRSLASKEHDDKARSVGLKDEENMPLKHLWQYQRSSSLSGVESHEPFTWYKNQKSKFSSNNLSASLGPQFSREPKQDQDNYFPVNMNSNRGTIPVSFLSSAVPVDKWQSVPSVSQVSTSFSPLGIAAQFSAPELSSATYLHDSANHAKTESNSPYMTAQKPGHPRISGKRDGQFFFLRHGSSPSAPRRKKVSAMTQPRSFSPVSKPPRTPSAALTPGFSLPQEDSASTSRGLPEDSSPSSPPKEPMSPVQPETSDSPGVIAEPVHIEPTDDKPISSNLPDLSTASKTSKVFEWIPFFHALSQSPPLVVMESSTDMVSSPASHEFSPQIVSSPEKKLSGPYSEVDSQFKFNEEAFPATPITFISPKPSSVTSYIQSRKPKPLKKLVRRCKSLCCLMSDSPYDSNTDTISDPTRASLSSKERAISAPANLDDISALGRMEGFPSDSKSEASDRKSEEQNSVQSGGKKARSNTSSAMLSHTTDNTLPARQAQNGSTACSVDSNNPCRAIPADQNASAASSLDLTDHELCPHWAHCGPNLALFDLHRVADILRDMRGQREFVAIIDSLPVYLPHLEKWIAETAREMNGHFAGGSVHEQTAALSSLLQLQECHIFRQP